MAEEHLMGMSHEAWSKLDDRQDTRYLVPIPQPKMQFQDSDLPFKIMILDFETTGYEPENSDPIALAYKKFQTNSEMTEFGLFEEGLLYNEPSEVISEEITFLTGITNEMVAGRRITSDDVENLTNNVCAFGAHNAAFDKRFAKKIGFPDVPWFCTWKDMEHHSSTAVLSHLLALRGYYFRHHDPMEDVNAASLLFLETPKEILTKALMPKILVRAVVSYDDKEKIKALGFRWNKELSKWQKIVEKEDAPDVIKTLNNVDWASNVTELEVPASFRL